MTNKIKLIALIAAVALAAVAAANHIAPVKKFINNNPA